MMKKFIITKISEKKLPCLIAPQLHIGKKMPISIYSGLGGEAI